MKKVKHTTGAGPGKVKAEFNLLSKNLFWVIVIPLLTILAYKSVTDFKLVNWDDKRYVLETEMVRGLTGEHVKQMFTTKVLRSYNPIVLLSFAVDYELAELKPGFSHGVNLLFHVFNALLVFLVMKKLGFRKTASGLIALLFALHPMQVEAVAWIAGRKDMIYGFFFLLAWYFYIDFFRSRKKMAYALSLLFFLLSLFSKVQAITLPFVLILTDYMLATPFRWKSLLNKIPFFALSVVFGLVALSGSSMVADLYTTPPTLLDKLNYSIMGFGLYLQKLILPIQQSAVYSFPEAGSAEFIRLMATGIIAIALVVFAVVKTIKKARPVAAGLMFYSVMIAVVLHLVAFNSALIYERFTYLASLGIFISVMNLDLLFPSWSNLKIRSITVIIVLFGIMTNVRAAVWKDPLSMWSDVIEKNPRAAEAYNNRGMVYLEKGENNQALEDFNNCIKVRPEQPDAYNNRSVVHFNEKDYRAALADNDIVLSIDPRHRDGIKNRACFYFNLEEFDSSNYYYQKTLELNSKDAQAYYFIGFGHYKMKEYRQAVDNYLQALRLFPRYADAYAFMGVSYVRLGMPDSAEYCVQMAENIAPNSIARKVVSTECVSMGSDLYARRDVDGAFRYYSLASKIKPDNANAYYSLGGIYFTKRDIAKARECWQKTLEIDPNHKDARDWLVKIGG